MPIKDDFYAMLSERDRTAAVAFGMAGIASAVLGKLADATSILFVVKACSFPPLLGLLTAFLPDLKSHEQDSELGES